MKQITPQLEKLIVVTRRDLTPGYQLVQANHAVAKFIFEFTQIAKKWYDESNYIATLATKNESELHLLINKAKEKNINFTIFCEPDIDNQITAICLEPSELSRKLCSSIPLALKEFNNPSLINKHNKEEII